MSGSMTIPTLDFATVVFRRELGLLRVQARSFARHVPPGAVNRVFVIVNDAEEQACLDAVERLRDDYGPLKHKLSVLPAGDLLRWPTRAARLRAALSDRMRVLRGRSGAGWHGRSGWYMQQALKLAVARVAEAPCVVLFDAKNHLLSPCDLSVFMASDGRPRAAPVVLDDYHFAWRRNAHAFFGCPPPARQVAALPTVTPFPVQTADLAATLAEVEARGGPVQTLFRPRDRQATEFTLIDAWCSAAHGGWSDRFSPGLADANVIYRNAGPEDIARALRRAEEGSTPFFGIHREAFALLTEADRDRLAAIWRVHGLADRIEDALAIP